MNRTRGLYLVVGFVLVVLLAPTSVLAQGVLTQPDQGMGMSFSRVCDGPALIGYAQCMSIIRTDSGAAVTASGTPQGYGPSDLRSAYNLPTPGGAPGTGPLVAIVDAYDDPNAEADMNVYRSYFGLGSCTSGPNGNGCFQKVNQSGIAGSYPQVSRSWAQEISLDLDMVSAICPSCKILLVEANSSSLGNLGTAVNTAARMGAVVISNSYGGFEFWGTNSIDQKYFNHPGVAITASAGDSGYGVEFPASSANVTAVGGTTLTKAANTRGWNESVWKGTGSGCSRFVAKPSWQHDTKCSKRTVADVAAVADPATGVAVYDSLSYRWRSGWLVFGGTSVSAPIIAGVYALAGNAGSVTAGSYSYSHTGSLNDIVNGSNGSCAGSYLCTAGSGYDGPTGNGTPNGTGGF